MLTLQKCVLDFADKSYETAICGIWWIFLPMSKRIWHTDFTLKIDTYSFNKDLVNTDSIVRSSCSAAI